jgi:hypothetical protein
MHTHKETSVETIVQYPACTEVCDEALDQKAHEDGEEEHVHTDACREKKDIGPVDVGKWLSANTFVCSCVCVYVCIHVLVSV